MRTDYKICPFCSATLDPGESCDCQRVNRQPEKVPRTVAQWVDAPIVSPKLFRDPTLRTDHRQRHEIRAKSRSG